MTKNEITNRSITTLRRGAFAAIATLLGSAAAFAQAVAPPPPTISINEYSAKFLCGDAKEVIAVRPGTYATSINIHNPEFRTVTFLKKAVRSPREEEPAIPPGVLKYPLTLGP